MARKTKKRRQSKRARSSPKAGKAKKRKVRTRPRGRVRRRARATGRVRAARKIRPKRQRKVLDPRLAQALKLYEEAVRQFNRQSYRRAGQLFEKVVAGPSRELAERARVHLVICEQRLRRPAPVNLRTAEDHYHYAVSQINMAQYDGARVHLEKARKLAPKADYVYYALASVAALSGEHEEALDYLAQSIKLSPENRYHARNDPDFKPLEDDTRYRELVFTAEAGGPPAEGIRFRS